jgi:Fis family transcriptional regulator, factor for inversion stimulation protein
MRDLLDKLVVEMVDRGVDFEDARTEFEKRFIAKVLDKSDGNLCRAAEILGVHRNTLTRQIKKLKIRGR